MTSLRNWSAVFCMTYLPVFLSVLLSNQGSYQHATRNLILPSEEKAIEQQIISENYFKICVLSNLIFIAGKVVENRLTFFVEKTAMYSREISAWLR